MVERLRDALRAVRSRLARTATLCAIGAIRDNGVLPSHIAFVMDGNRRYADTYGKNPIHGHVCGYGTLLDVLRYCLMLQVSTVSVYAFSIDNYTRSDEEVGLLMRLMEEKLGELEKEAPRLREEGVKVRVLGDLSLAPRGVQEAARRVMEATEGNGKCVLNVMFSYTASEELVRAGRRCARQCSDLSGPCGGQGHVDDHLYAIEDVDLLIRTSGECRLSDFMLRQCRCCVLHFSKQLWPDFGLMDLLEGVMAYQRQVGAVVKARDGLGRAKAQIGLEAAYCVGNRVVKGKQQEGRRSPSSVLSVDDDSDE